MVDGKLLWSGEDGETLLALLLENVGADRAAQLGDPEVWRAVATWQVAQDLSQDVRTWHTSPVAGRQEHNRLCWHTWVGATARSA
jgi:hypothetical protein